MLVQTSDFIRFKGFLVDFLEKRPPENRRKSGLFSEPRLLQCTWFAHF